MQRRSGSRTCRSAQRSHIADIILKISQSLRAAGAASVTFFAQGGMDGSLPDYFQYSSSVNGTSVSSSTMAFNTGASASVGTVNTTVGPADFAITSPYTLSSKLTLGLNSGDSATLTFQTDPSPTALSLPSASALLALGLVGLSALGLRRKKRFV